ncbi:MAG: hypothetical protein K5837_01990 [Candidatus Saccharibacteria bacterium]|nr:hypothetical protein [Candidatus Saccharibacteria bacterium]
MGFYFHGSPILLADKTFAEEPLVRWRPDLSLQVNPDGRLLISRQKSDDTYLVLATLQSEGNERDEEIITTRTGIESIKVLYSIMGVKAYEGVYNIVVLKACKGDFLCITKFGDSQRVVYLVADDGSVIADSRTNCLNEWRRSPYLSKLPTEGETALRALLPE